MLERASYVYSLAGVSLFLAVALLDAIATWRRSARMTERNLRKRSQ
jgi:hypothetical protein